MPPAVLPGGKLLPDLEEWVGQTGFENGTDGAGSIGKPYVSGVTMSQQPGHTA